MTALPVCLAHQLEVRPEERRWLIEGLWSTQAVGIVGGEPKCCKSFLALDMAVAVASGASCLRRFPVAERGRVLLFAAEDALPVVRQRLAGIAAAGGLSLESLDIQVIVAPVLRLDVEEDRQRLEDTVRELRPVLLVLDPFVRMHRVDENVSADVAPLLGFLRGLQRRHGIAVVLVHHARKGGAHLRAGQALRGSSELHAWGDSNLYLRRSADEELLLTIEHRAAPSASGMRLELAAEGDALALRVIDTPDAAPDEAPGMSPHERVEAILRHHGGPMTQREIRHHARMRASTIGDVLAALVAAGTVVRSDGRYAIVAR